MMKPDLILLPSPLIMAHTYQKVVEMLSPIFQVHIFDLPDSGMAFQQRVWNEHNYERWLHQKVRRLRLKSFYLLGHSNSGAVALKYTALHPDQVRGLILADTIGVERQNFFKTFAGRMVDGLIEFKFSLWGSSYMLWNAIAHTKNFFFQVFQAADTELKDEISKIETPTLILWGERDHTMPVQFAFKLKHAIRNSEIVLDKNGSHDCLITDREKLFRSIKRWMLWNEEKGPATGTGPLEVFT